MYMTNNLTFPDLVKQEVKRAGEMYGPIHSIHEGYGVIAEEVAEFFDAVRLKDFERNVADITMELAQIGAIAQRIAEDLQYIPQSLVQDGSKPDVIPYLGRIIELEAALTTAIKLLESGSVAQQQLGVSGSMRNLTFHVDVIGDLQDILDA